MFVCARLTHSICRQQKCSKLLSLEQLFSQHVAKCKGWDIVSPTLMSVGNIGLSSSKKSGVYDILMQKSRKETSVLERLASNSEILIFNGLSVHVLNIPVEVKTENVPAGLSSLASRRNANSNRR